jgi:hypothetical protein
VAAGNAESGASETTAIGEAVVRASQPALPDPVARSAAANVRPKFRALVATPNGGNEDAAATRLAALE